MTNKELQKLGRRELLQLLLEQAKEAERLGKLLKENDEHLKQLEESYERLRERLDKKDVQIHDLKKSLETEREKREAAEQAVRYGGYAPAPPGPEQYPHRPQGGYPMGGGGAAPGPEPGGIRQGFQGAAPYQPQPAPDPYAGQYPPQTPDPFPYQAPPQSPDPYQVPDPFPYQTQYQTAPMTEPYPAGAAVQYQYPPYRPERRRQGGAHGKMPFQLKKDPESGKTALLFGWQHK